MAFALMPPVGENVFISNNHRLEMSKFTKSALIIFIIQISAIYIYKSGLLMSQGSDGGGATAVVPVKDEIQNAYPVNSIDVVPSVSKTDIPAAEKAELMSSNQSLEIDQLIRTGNPNDVMKAYEVISNCAKQIAENSMKKNALPNATQIEKEFGVPPEACGNISSQKLASRLQFLEYAAAAGVKNAAVRMLNEGPLGDSDSNTEEVWSRNGHDLWKKKVIDYLILAGERGDAAALANLFRLAEYPSSKIDGESAIKYGSVALALIKSGSAYHAANPEAFKKLEDAMKSRMETYGRNSDKEQVMLSMGEEKK